MNNTQGGTATTIDLQSLAPVGVNVSPASFPVNLSSGGMTTLNFSVSGPLFAGDIIKLSGLLSGLDSSDMPFECTDTICLEIPNCPVDECCTGEGRV